MNMDRRKWLMVLVALVVIIAAVLGYMLTRSAATPVAERKAELAEKQEARLQDVCASKATYDRLKEVAFEEAVRIRNADPANLDTLAASSVVRMERPVVKSRDEALNVTVCSGRFVLELPPGAETGFGGDRRLIADIEYAAQAAADGSGLVFQIRGAEPIIYKLAAFDLQGRRFQPTVPPGETDYAETLPAPATPSETRPLPPVAPPIYRPEPAPPPPVAEPVPAPRPTLAPNRSNPSFNCRHARTRGERMVCDSNQLAARDRAMSSLYYSSIADADPATKRRIRASRDAFLSRRDRCGSEACMAGVYDDRIEEIRRIAGGGE